MSALKNGNVSPLIIGGDTKIGCELLSNLIGSILKIGKISPSNILCHPGLWASPQGSGKWKEHIFQSLISPYPTINGRLSWCVQNLSALTENLVTESMLRELLISSSDIREFIDQLAAPAMATKNSRQWIDSTPENIYSMESILDSFPQSKALIVVRDGRAAVYDRIKRTYSAKAAAKIWVIQTAIEQYLQVKYSNTERLLTIRLEDLLENPEKTLSAIIQHFQIPADSHQYIAPNTWLSPDTSSFEPTLLTESVKMKESLTAWQSLLPSNFEQYLYSTFPHTGKLKELGINALPASGAESLIHLGYPPARHTIKKTTLRQNEQTLQNSHSKFVNPLAQYRTPQVEHLNNARPHGIQHVKHNIFCLKYWAKEIPLERFHQNRSFLHYVFCLKCWNRKLKLYTALLARPNIETEKIPHSLSPTNLEANPNSIAKEHNKTTSNSPKALNHPSIELVVVIAFHGRRHEVLELLIKELSQSSTDGLALKAILVCSTKEDQCFVAKLKEKYHFVTAKSHPNQPLGAKWQAGVEEARQFNPNFLMIMGSDDIMSAHFLTNALQLMRRNDVDPGFDLIAPSSWHLYDCDSNSSYIGSLWELTYQNHQPVPLGAGRIYSSVILDRFDWHLFHPSLKSRLDSLGFQQVIEHQGNVYRLPLFMGTILSVKGNWSNLNSTDKILTAAAIRSKSIDFFKSDFFSENFSFTETELLDWFQKS